MDITTILEHLQTFAPIYLSVTITLFVVGAITMAWNYYTKYTNRQYSKLRIIHIKKLAGTATDEELELLSSQKIPINFNRKKRKKFVWKDFVEKYDIREDLKKMNPFKVIHQLEALQRELKSVKDTGNSFRWSIDDRIKRGIEDSKKPKKEKITSKPIPAQRPRGKYESHLNPAMAKDSGGSSFV